MKSHRPLPHPILYSFRRCPYAMRARLAISISQVTVEIREIILRDKPEMLLTASPKGTVPVLVTPENRVIDESLEIMLWALRQHDPQGCLGDHKQQEQAQVLIKENDASFKQHLDRYKYHDRYPEYSKVYYREQGEVYLNKLDVYLKKGTYLLGETVGLADLAIFPFVRQFAHTDQAWFYHTPYHHLQKWLDNLLTGDAFNYVMHKYPVWQPGDVPTLLETR